VSHKPRSIRVNKSEELPDGICLPIEHQPSWAMSAGKLESTDLLGATGGQKETVGQTWELDLTFKTKAP
jgi:hypothetical protein